MALEYFAREVGAGTRKRVLLVLDQAGWHTAKNKLRVPEGIHLEFLPAHSPELMPSALRLLRAKRRRVTMGCSVRLFAGVAVQIVEFPRSARYSTYLRSGTLPGPIVRIPL